MEIPKRILYPSLVMLLLLAALATTLYALGYYNFKSMTVSNLFFKGKIALVPLVVDEGSTEGWFEPPYEVLLIKTQIEDIFSFEVDVLAMQEMPENAYYSPRGSYDARLVLDYLTAAKPDRYDKVIGLTDSDISANVQDSSGHSVIGLSYRGGEASIISTYRVGSEKLNGGRYERRLAKASLHEIGHTLGLPHCDNTPSCFMTEASGQVKTIDSEEIILCGSCRRLITYTQN